MAQNVTKLRNNYVFVYNNILNQCNLAFKV